MDSLVKLQLSKYVMIRRTEALLYLEQPLTGSRIPIQKSSILNLLFCFAVPTSKAELLEKTLPRAQPQIVKMIDFLVGKEVLVPAEAENSKGISDKMWEFHDLFFHTQSRKGLNFNALGATYRFGNEAGSEDFVRSFHWEGKEIDLPVEPTSAASEITLNEALRQRRTSYEFSSLDLADISGLLFDSVRVKEVSGNDSSEKKLRKFYPSGGSLHSIETYLAVVNCRNLPTGIYYYDGLKHKLIAVNEQENFVRMVAEDAARSMSQTELPAMVMIFTARFERVFVKYESLGYRLILLELGSVFQSLYLAAAKHNLSVCALGSGNSTAFSDGLGLEYLKETSIGEFAVNGKF